MEQEWEKRFRARMEDMGFTMKSLSIAAGLNDSYVRDMLMRKRQPTIDKFCRLADALRVTVGYLLGEEASTTQQSAAEVDVTAQLRSVLLAFGVDREDLGRAVSAVKVFVDDLDEQPSPDLPDDQSELSSRPRVKAP